ncbi:hypothetical protein [Streptomyces sp. NPDC048191]|uniref:hypothetical protein n=1 Tax=Streptomyces sp. NPDC048191 TaxID=3155484 RepID=UPI0033FA6393
MTARCPANRAAGVRRGDRLPDRPAAGHGGWDGERTRLGAGERTASPAAGVRDFLAG